MARDGALPQMLSRIHPIRKVPDRAILLVAALHLGLGIAVANHFELLASLVSFGALVGFLMLHLSVVVHFIWRRKSRQWLRHLLAPVIGFVITAFVLLNMGPQAQVAGVVWLLIGMVALAALKWRNRRVTLPI